MQGGGLVMWGGGLSCASCRWLWPAGLRLWSSKVARWLHARDPVAVDVLVEVAYREVPTMQSPRDRSLSQEAVADNLAAVACPVTAASCRRLLLLAPLL